MSQKKNKVRSKAKKEEEKEQGKEEIGWSQLPDMFEGIAKAVVTPIKSVEREKRLGIE